MAGLPYSALSGSPHDMVKAPSVAYWAASILIVRDPSDPWVVSPVGGVYLIADMVISTW